MVEEEKQEEITPVEEQDEKQEETTEEELDYNAIADEIERLRKENEELKKQTESFKKKEEDGRERLKRILLGREQIKSSDIEEEPKTTTPSGPVKIPEDFKNQPIDFGV